MKLKKQKGSRDQGMALVTVMLLLIPITLIAITSLRMNIADEGMVANSYLTEKARAGAESALRYAEKELRLNPSLYYAAFSALDGDDVVFDDDLENNNVGEDCWHGVCLPLNVTDWDPSVDVASRKRGGQWVVSNVSNVWANPDQYRTVPNLVANSLGLDIQPKYIIEFMGHIPRVRDDGRLYNSLCDANGDGFSGPGEAAWDRYPYCRQDPLMFRITSLGEAGPGGRAKIALQSTYIIDSNSL